MFKETHRDNAVGIGLLAFAAGVAAWAIFGKKITNEVKRNPDLRDLRRQVYRKASQISDITREKYDDVVDEVTKNYSKVKDISENELADLVTDLKMHWGRIKDAWN